MTRAYSVTDVLKKRFDTMPFDGQYRQTIGRPERSGSWIIGGVSASGKTTFIFQLAKYLTQFERVYYNSLEEGVKRTTQMVVERVDMAECKRRFILTREPIEDMIERLSKRKSPNIVVTDSIQHAMLKKRDYLDITRMFPNKLFIWVTHLDERNKPVGSVANFIWYDSDVKMRTEGYKMFADTRYLEGEPQPFTIWKEGAEKYWGHFDGAQ